MPEPTPEAAAGATAGARRLAELTWPEAAAIAPERAVAILPVGAVEAHGPHLPLATDRLIAEAMAGEGARRLAAAGWAPLVLPPIEYTAAPFAAGFAGTVSVRPQTVAALIVDVAAALAGRGWRCLAIANAHLDPAHLGALAAAVEEIRAAGRIAVACPDLTRRPWAARLGEEFASGACHAGRYEGSIVLAARPDLVREEARRALAPNPASLSRAIRAGLATFEQAGGPHAYFGDPAAASAGEGRERIAELGRILEEAVLEAVGETVPAGASAAGDSRR
jgi:creatinine amidohydrolase